MFRFRDPKQPPQSPKPWHAHARTCAGFAARNALLGAAVAAKGTADALRWAAERQPAPPAPPTVPPVPVVVLSPPPALLAARPPKPSAPRCGKSSSKVLPILAAALLIGFVAALTGVQSNRGRSISAPPPPQNMTRMSAARLTEYATDNGVVGGAKAALKALEQKAKAELVQPNATIQSVPPATPPTPPPPPSKTTSSDTVVNMSFHIGPDLAAAKPQPAIRLTGLKSGSPQTTKESALNDALLVAQARLVERFARLDPPLNATPSLELIREHYLIQDKVAEVRPTSTDREAWQKAGLDPDRFWVTVDVEVSENQVRQLRGDHRLASQAPLFLLPLILSGGLYGFLRLDAWTKGHLTGWLLTGVGGLVLAGVALLVASRVVLW